MISLSAVARLNQLTRQSAHTTCKAALWPSGHGCASVPGWSGGAGGLAVSTAARLGGAVHPCRRPGPRDEPKRGGLASCVGPPPPPPPERRAGRLRFGQRLVRWCWRAGSVHGRPAGGRCAPVPTARAARRAEARRARVLCRLTAAATPERRAGRLRLGPKLVRWRWRAGSVHGNPAGGRCAPVPTARAARRAEARPRQDLQRARSVSKLRCDLKSKLRL